MFELLQASSYAALVYLLLNYFITFGSGRPLVEAINPNRRFLPLLALGMFGIAYTLLLKGVWKYQISHLELLWQLVNEEKAKPETVGAISFLVFGVAVMLLYLWCWWNLPRDPRTFSQNPKVLVKEYAKALKHFIRWRGGLDYAFLCEVREGEHRIIAEALSHRDVRSGLLRVTGIDHAELVNEPDKAIDRQRLLWQEEARRLISDWPHFFELTKSVRQGELMLLALDLKIGACYIETLECPTGDPGKPNCLYLFAACLNQFEVSNMMAGKHFYSLAEAIRTIRRGVIKS